MTTTARGGHVSVDATLGHEDAIELLERQTEVLELVASGTSLGRSLASLVVALERLMPGARCSILLFDPATATLQHGASPNLPRDYTAAIDGMRVGPAAGSCGTAAYTGAPVIVEDIQVDARWQDFRRFAEPHGLRSCWSTPIRGQSGISGTFAVYHDEPHVPSGRERLLIERFIHLASLAIDQARLFEALSDSEERFRSAFEDNAVGMALTTVDLSVVKVNHALTEMLRRSDSEVLGRLLTDLVVVTGSERELLRHLLTGRRDRAHLAATAMTSDQRGLQLTLDASLLRAADGRPASVIVNLLDVTQRHAAEAERRARREAEVARQVAESASQAKSGFVTALTHEVRTPLQAIAGFTEMLQGLDLSAEQRAAALAHIRTATAHISALVDDALDIAKIEAGSLPLRWEAVSVDPVVADVIALVAPLAEERDVVLSGPRGFGVVEADERRLRQVLLNLTTNAVRYNRPGGRVDILGECGPDAEVSIHVRDTGPGLPDHWQERLFVPFDRLGAEDGGEQGAGLGLVLARELVEAMHGRLIVRSELGVGTTMTVVLPIARTCVRGEYG